MNIERTDGVSDKQACWGASLCSSSSNNSNNNHKRTFVLRAGGLTIRKPCSGGGIPAQIWVRACDARVNHAHLDGGGPGLVRRPRRRRVRIVPAPLTSKTWVRWQGIDRLNDEIFVDVQDILVLLQAIEHIGD